MLVQRLVVLLPGMLDAMVTSNTPDNPSPLPNLNRLTHRPTPGPPDVACGNRSGRGGGNQVSVWIRQCPMDLHCTWPWRGLQRPRSALRCTRRVTVVVASAAPVVTNRNALAHLHRVVLMRLT